MLTEKQKLELGQLIHDALNVSACCAQRYRSNPRNGGIPPELDYLAEFHNPTMHVLDYVWRIGKAFENLPVVMHSEAFDPLIMCQYLLFIEDRPLTGWTKLTRRAADIVGFVLPPFNPAEHQKFLKWDKTA